MKLRNLAVVVLSLVIGVSSLVACNSSSSKNNEDLSTLKDAVQSLSDSTDTCIVSNCLELPDGDIDYIEVNKSDGNSYTEYPSSTESGASNTSYALYDWLTSDNKLYQLNSEYSDNSSNNLWVSMPDTYAKEIASRKVLFVDKMYDGLSEFKEDGTLSLDLGTGAVDVTKYTAKLDSDSVKSILGVNSLSLYQTVKDENKDNKNIVGLMDDYIAELDISLVFSDANIIFGVYDGKLVYLQLEAGGLGTRMYYTKTVLTQAIEERTIPDFTSSKTYVDSIKDLADYVSNYDSYEDAMNALNESQTSSEQSTTSTEEATTSAEQTTTANQ